MTKERFIELALAVGHSPNTAESGWLIGRTYVDTLTEEQIKEIINVVKDDLVRYGVLK